MGRLLRFAWVVLAWNLVVILLGALVRATGSGAGCGRSWPTCRDQVVPPLQGATAFEYSHRVASGIAIVAVVSLAVAVWRARAPSHLARRSALLAVVAIAGEALIGAGIVFFEWVAEDASTARALAVPLHLINTFLLLAALALTAHWLGGEATLRGGKERGRAAVPGWIIWGGVGLVLTAATGAVAALADTLFPSDSVGAGVAADLSAAEHFLTRLRVLHPAVAVITAGVLVGQARRRLASRAARLVSPLVGAQLAAGILNLLLLTPVWLQLVHLALAEVLWVDWVLLGAGLVTRPRSELGDQNRVGGRRR